MLYDYKSEETVQYVDLECMCPLLDDIVDEWSMLRRFECITVYAPLWVCAKLRDRLIWDEELGDFYDQVEDEAEYFKYDDDEQALLSVYWNGALYIEHARWPYKQNLKKDSESVLSYVHDSFSTNELDYLAEDMASVLVFGFDEDEEKPDDGYSIEIVAEKDNPDNVHGFYEKMTTENGFIERSYVSSDVLKPNELKKLLDLWI